MKLQPRSKISSTENERISEVLKEVNVSLSENTQQSMANKSLESIDTLPLLSYALAEEEALLFPDTAKEIKRKRKKQRFDGILKPMAESMFLL